MEEHAIMINVMTLIFLLIWGAYISIEEKVLINHFSGHYVEYMKRTKLLIPRLY